MRDVVFKDGDIRALAKRVGELSSCINRDFLPRINEGCVCKLFLEDIERFKDNNNILVHWSGG